MAAHAFTDLASCLNVESISDNWDLDMRAVLRSTVLVLTPTFNWMYIHEIAHCLTSLDIPLNIPLALRWSWYLRLRVKLRHHQMKMLICLFGSAKFSTLRIDDITTSHRSLHFVLNQLANVSNGSWHCKATNWWDTLHDGNDALQIFELASNFNGKSATV